MELNWLIFTDSSKNVVDYRWVFCIKYLLDGYKVSPGLKVSHCSRIDYYISFSFVIK